MQQMNRLHTNVTQSQQIPEYLHHLNQRPKTHLQNAQSFLNVQISPTSPYVHSYNKTPHFFDSPVSRSIISYQRTQKVKSSCNPTSSSFQQQFISYNHHQKINCLLDVILIYRKLVAEHGLFLLSKDHLKIDCIGRAVVLVNRDIGVTQSALFLNSSKFNQWRVVQAFVDLFSKHFSELFFKYAKIRSLQDLQNFFSMVKKRNQIHKRCKYIVKQMSRSKIRTSLSAKSISPDGSASKKFDLQQRPSSYFGAKQSKSNLSISTSSKYFIPVSQKKREHDKECLDNGRKSQFDTTTNISCSVLGQNKSYLQIHNIYNRSDTKRNSCVVKPAQNQNCFQSYAKKTSMVAKYKEHMTQIIPLVQKENKKIIQSFGINGQERSENDMKASLQKCFQGLFLSQIAEDTQNEVLNSVGATNKMDQFMKDFQNVFY